MKQLLLDIKPAAPPTLQNFVVGRNAEAIASLEMAINGQNPQFIYLWGESALAKAICYKPARQ